MSMHTVGTMQTQPAVAQHQERVRFVPTDECGAHAYMVHGHGMHAWALLTSQTTPHLVILM